MNDQAPMPNADGSLTWSLRFGHSLVIRIWSLVISPLALGVLAFTTVLSVRSKRMRRWIRRRPIFRPRRLRAAARDRAWRARRGLVAGFGGDDLHLTGLGALEGVQDFAVLVDEADVELLWCKRQ